MPKSNGFNVTWARHDRVLCGKLRQIVEMIRKRPGVAERNERRLREFEQRTASVNVLRTLRESEPANDSVPVSPPS